MRKKIAISATACVLAALLGGCGDKKDIAADSRQGAANQGVSQSIRSKSDLQRLLVSGMETNKIVAILGEPRLIEDLSQTEQVWHHVVPPFAEKGETPGAYIGVVVGVVIGITNGHLAYWGCISTSVPDDPLLKKSDVLPNDTDRSASSGLKFFVVSANPIASGQFIDTERFPKLGFIPRTPALAIRAIKEVTMEERTLSGAGNQARKLWSFNVFLTQEDAMQLKSVTETNISNKLLIMTGDEPISAAEVIMPVETGSFVIECQDRALMELVKTQLARLVLQRQ